MGTTYQIEVNKFFLTVYRMGFVVNDRAAFKRKIDNK